MLSGAEYDNAIATQLTPAQVVWHEELVHKANIHFGVVRGESGNEEDLADVCEWLWSHLIKATGSGAVNATAASSVSPLWSDAASVSTSWAELLCPVGSRIIRDRRPLVDSKDPFHSYQLLLQGANKQVTHILACQSR